MKALFEKAHEKGEVEVKQNENLITVKENGRSISFAYEKSNTGFRFFYKNKILESAVGYFNGDEIHLQVNGKATSFKWKDLRSFSKTNLVQEAWKIGEIRAVMPGRVAKIYVKSGEHVSAGDSLLVLEAMKMENEIKSPAQGVIKEIHVGSGESVEKDALLVTLDPKSK